MDKSVSLLIKTFIKKELTLALAESMTCGLAAHKLSTCPGTSDVLIGSIVCYSPHVKNNILGVSMQKIKKFTCESQQVTDEMTRNLSKIIEANVFAGITGLASPGGSENKRKPVGTVFLSVYFNKSFKRKKMLFKGSPMEIKKKACLALYRLILSAISNYKKPAKK